MNRHIPIRGAPAGLLAGALIFLGVTAPNRAATPPPLQAQLIARPLTPGEVTRYGLPADSQTSGGLFNVGKGASVYLEIDVNSAVPAADIVSVDWSLASKPVGSEAALEASPLGENVPVYEPSERLVSRVAARKLLRPDMTGQYTVKATVTTASSGTADLVQVINAGTYMGINTCALCHSGGTVAPNQVIPWEKSPHAKGLSDGLDGNYGDHFGSRCLSCHTTGFDANPNAVNGGFDDIAKAEGWEFPTEIKAGNWDELKAAHPNLANVSNVQCESCHGPGSEHAYHLGKKDLIAVTFSSGDCNQCHDAPTHHAKGTEWYNSIHAVTTRSPSGPGREGCVGCHTGTGFVARIADQPITDPSYSPIGCQACHEPHGKTVPAEGQPNPNIIRTLASVKFEDGSTITTGGKGMLCMQCHHARVDAKVYATEYHSRFGPHHGPQGDMIQGVNGFTYGKEVPSSAHRTAVEDTCVTCHMQTVESGDPAFLNAGGHTFRMAWTAEGKTENLVAACQKCHGANVTDFDFRLQDYDGDGQIDGVQTEVRHLMDRLARLLPPYGQPKTTVEPSATWSAPELEAAYNYLFVLEDGSMGIHNTAYAVGLLKASIASLTGDANNDTLPDAWQIQYFGSINHPDAAPNANPAGDGVPNWLKYTLGLDPMQPGVSAPDGVVWAGGNSIGGGSDSVRIYTAAEIVFDTEQNSTYQIQCVSSLSGGWQNIGSSMAGTGGSIRYVTPTRNDAKMFFRVVKNP